MIAMRSKGLLASLAIGGLIAACGGGGGGAGSTGGGGAVNGGGETAATGMAYGTITAFGSVWVNGVEFQTTGATVRIDDNPVGADDLRIGMVVRIDGSISGATAQHIAVEESVKGRVERGLANGTLVVMGQTVQVDAHTQFGNDTVPAVGEPVEVHGLVAGDGVIAAGYIERKTTLAGFSVKGVVKHHDAAAQTFQVGTLTVVYAGAATGDMPAGSWNGLQAVAKGSACANASGACGTLTASKVQPAGAAVAEAAQAEVEGIVGSLDADGFSIGNQKVVVSSSTAYVNGVAADVVPGTRVEAEGAISQGVLAATRVSIKDSARAEADVATVDAAAGTLTLAGLPGLIVTFGPATELKNLGSLAEVAAGGHLRLRGRPGLGNSIVATELELRDTRSDPRVELRAAAQAIGSDSLTLQGVVVDTSGFADADFKDGGDASIGRSAFFAGIRVGSVLKLRGSLSGSRVAWKEAEIETP